MPVRTLDSILLSSSLLLAASVARAAPAAASDVASAELVTRAKSALIKQLPTAALATLAHSHTFQLPNGSRVVRFAQERAGLPVIGRGAAVLLDPSGAATKLAVANLDARAPTSAVPAI